jgi:hypothetical protein
LREALRGRGAAAPYLHNRSVPTLAQLLKPAAQRASQFNLGTKYDTKALVSLLRKTGRLGLSPIAMTSIQETADAVTTSPRP